MTETPTISQALITWLYGFGNISVNERIETDALAAAAQSLGLYKSPQTVIKPYIGGDRDITAYYQFLVNQDAQTNASRMSNQAWLEGLEGWVRRQNLAHNLPDLGMNRECCYVTVSSPFHMANKEGKEAVYQLSIGINYIERVNET